MVSKCKKNVNTCEVIDYPMIQVTINKKAFMGMFDSTSKRTLAGPDVISHLRVNNLYTSLTPLQDARLYSRFGQIIQREEAVINMTWTRGATFNRLIFIPELACDLILGRDF